jgi:hypothetical protein
VQARKALIEMADVLSALSRKVGTQLGERVEA